MGNARRACARSRLFIMSSPILFLSGGSALVLSAIPFTAAHADAGGDPSIIVTAQSATDEARSEIEKRPGGVDVVSADSFKDKVAVSLRDALAFPPGVYTQPRFGQEVRLSIRGSGISRGYHMRGITLLQDGIPINLADDNGDFQELDPQVFERIEVYRGANALSMGGSTLGRSEEHTSALQSLMRISYAVFCLKQT